MSSIHINQLKLRLKGIPVATAQAALAQLPATLQERLRASGTRGSCSQRELGDLRLGTIRLDGPANPGRVSQALAQSIAGGLSNVRSSRPSSHNLV